MNFQQIQAFTCAILLCCASTATPQAVQDGQSRLSVVTGLVTDGSGAAIADATVVWSHDDATTGTQAATGADGQFSLSNLPVGPYRLVVSAPGFAKQTVSGVLAPGEVSKLPPIQLTLAFNAASVEVKPTIVEVAEQQIKQEEQQRFLGVLPNYFVTYAANAVPLTAKQKFKLSRASVLDPVDFISTGIVAAVQQKRHDYAGFGDGPTGYAKRYAAFYASIVTRGAIDQVLLPSLFKQDPRYFYKGTGSTASRVGYAIGTAVVRKGDNGHWQPNYSGVLGSLATGALTNLYYPAADRKGARLTLENSAIGLASAAAAHLAQEFLFSKLTTHSKPPQSSGQNSQHAP